MEAKKAQDRRLDGLELWLLMGIIVLVAGFHIILVQNAGAFWRDECSSIVLARSPSWKDLFAGLFTDSFPALWVILLRFWDLAGGHSDTWIRGIGFVFSIGAIGSIWLASKTVKLSRPILALALIALNPAVFYWGDSLRAYALALILVVLLFSFVWRFCETGASKDFALAALFGILAAQSNYQSTYLILAICLAGTLICLVKRSRWRGTLVLGIGFLAALSMLPYRPVVKQYDEPAQLIRVPAVDAGLLWERFTEGFDSWILLAILVELYALCVVLPFLFSRAKERKENREAFLRSLYAATIIIVAPLGCYFFARKAGFSTQSWYYIPLLGLIVIAIEMALTSLLERRRARQIRLILTCMVMIASLQPLWKQSHVRRTTMDLAATRIASEASENDLVLINPFWEIVSFQYYYKGKAPWSLLPVVPDDQRNLSYIAVKPLLSSAEPLKATFERIEKTLRQGGRVWIVGGLPKGNAPASAWIPAPHPVYGWNASHYMDDFAAQTAWFTTQNAVERRNIPVQSGQAVSRFENVEWIAVFSGWKNTIAKN